MVAVKAKVASQQPQQGAIPSTPLTAITVFGGMVAWVVANPIFSLVTIVAVIAFVLARQ